MAIKRFLFYNFRFSKDFFANIPAPFSSAWKTTNCFPADSCGICHLKGSFKFYNTWLFKKLFPVRIPSVFVSFLKWRKGLFPYFKENIYLVESNTKTCM